MENKNIQDHCHSEHLLPFHCLSVLSRHWYPVFWYFDMILVIMTKTKTVKGRTIFTLARAEWLRSQLS